MNHHQAFTIVAFSDGASAAVGEQVVKKTIADSPDPIRLGGIAHQLQRQLQM